MINKEKLYTAIDEEDEESDEEKRESYFAEIADAEAEEEWQNQH